MTKIKSLRIFGIRGVKDEIAINLDKKSVLIFGENGSGKSSLTDALEWYYSDSIEHLKSEESGAARGRGSLRNLFIPKGDKSYLEIGFSEGNLDSTKSIDSSLKSSFSNTSEDFNSYLSATQSENLYLRFRTLIEFIVSSKTEKLKKLQGIIGFSAVADMRDLLKKSAGRIARNIKSSNYDNQKNAHQSVILENLGQNAYSAEQLCEGSNILIKPLKLDREIKSIDDMDEVLRMIEVKEDEALLNQISFYTKVGENLTEISGNIEIINSRYSSYYSAYSEFRKDPENIKSLQLLALLKEGLRILKNDVVKDDFCPLCLQDKNKLELISELNQRISKLEELDSRKNALDDQRQRLEAIIQVNSNTLAGLIKEKLFEDDDKADLRDRIIGIQDSFKSIRKEIGKDLVRDDQIEKPDTMQVEREEIVKLATSVQDKARELKESKQDNIRFQVHARLIQAVSAFKNFRKVQVEQDILTKQQSTFQALYEDFIKRQEKALNVFLEMFSSDINSYYTTMNPGEKIENIKLVPIKDKNDDLAGITIEYSFFGETQSPPTAYLSESHINCLGLSFFLASVRAFNKKNKFFILDDVISSFDRPHRARFANLLLEKFCDYQILLLTHEQGFYELVGSEVKGKGWLIQVCKWSKSSGVEIEKGIPELRDRILKKFENKNIDGLGNDIRVFLEKTMKEIAHNIEAPVAFRFNEVNEKRMAPELLDAVQSRISKKSSHLKGLPNILKLKGIPMFISNVSSHDNEFKEGLDDLEAIWEEVKKAIDVFYCSSCNNCISIKFYDNVKKMIRCRCGNLAYDWK
jgi:energy-coupling factor transporter ATP-binding protein EcfA2